MLLERGGQAAWDVHPSDSGAWQPAPLPPLSSPALGSGPGVQPGRAPQHPWLEHRSVPTPTPSLWLSLHHQEETPSDPRGSTSPTLLSLKELLWGGVDDRVPLCCLRCCCRVSGERDPSPCPLGDALIPHTLPWCASSVLGSHFQGTFHSNSAFPIRKGRTQSARETKPDPGRWRPLLPRAVSPRPAEERSWPGQVTPGAPRSAPSPEGRQHPSRSPLCGRSLRHRWL